MCKLCYKTQKIEIRNLKLPLLNQHVRYSCNLFCYQHKNTRFSNDTLFFYSFSHLPIPQRKTTPRNIIMCYFNTPPTQLSTTSFPYQLLLVNTLSLKGNRYKENGVAICTLCLLGVSFLSFLSHKE